MTYFQLTQYKTTSLNVPGGITNSQTTGIILTDVTNVDITKPGIVALTYSVPLDTTKVETISYTSINGSNELVGVVRGVDNFSAKVHNDQCVVAFVISASHINNLADGLTNLDADFLVEHNSDGTHNDSIVVTLTGTQTLTNKTLTTPTITTPKMKRSISLQIFDAVEEVTTGDGKAYFTIPEELNGANLSAVHARVITAGTTGTTDIQIRNVTDTADMLSTKLTIDSGETGSDTAAAAAVINTSTDDVATNDLIAIDVDATATTKAKGLVVRLQFLIP